LSPPHPSLLIGLATAPDVDPTDWLEWLDRVVAVVAVGSGVEAVGSGIKAVGSEDSCGPTPLHTPGREQRGCIPAEAIATVALVSFIEVAGAPGQFRARARSRTSGSATSERRFSVVVRPRLAMAARKWSAVMARLVGWSGDLLASFTHKRAACWQA